jgi:hypothetical protein
MRVAGHPHAACAHGVVVDSRIGTHRLLQIRIGYLRAWPQFRGEQITQRGGAHEPTNFPYALRDTP